MADNDARFDGPPARSTPPSHPDAAPEIDDCVVLIESADPEFDWIFLHHVAALVTKYGGANSHMAIWCAEFELPAAIGCGARAERGGDARNYRVDFAKVRDRLQFGPLFSSGTASPS